MNIFQLKIIAMIAMFLDHIAYFFPDLPMSLPLHWVNSNPRIPFVTQDSLFVNENPVL